MNFFVIHAFEESMKRQMATAMDVYDAAGWSADQEINRLNFAILPGANRLTETLYLPLPMNIRSPENEKILQVNFSSFKFNEQKLLRVRGYKM